MSKKKRKKVRVEFRQNWRTRGRETSSKWTKRLKDKDEALDETVGSEAVKGKGRIGKKKTVDLAKAQPVMYLEMRAEEPAGPESAWREGTVIAIHGHFAKVDDGQTVRNCVVRGVLKSLLVEQQNVVTVGDRVYFTPLEDNEGVIEQIAPRHGALVRHYKKRDHMLVANVDQVLIVSSVAEPELRIHIIDRYIVAALANELKPVIVFNKIDLPYDEPLDDYERAFDQLQYPVVRTSAAENVGIDALREVMKDRKSVLAGLSGVGKSSLINAVQPGLDLTVKPVNRATRRGQHTTSMVHLLKLGFGGYVVDTPGIRQFGFSELERDLVAYFEEFLPYLGQCKYPNCSHTHEDDCAVKEAVEAGDIADWRYDSYVRMYADQQELSTPWQS